MINKIFIGDALQVLKDFPDNFVDMCITSPPYYGLRDYGINGQLGQESDFNVYINKLLAIFDEVKRVLKKAGTCWVNISDTYKNKSLLGIPFQFAQGMLSKGWILRNTIIWHKPNAMPINVKDRFTIDFEYLFFFSKNKKYYFEQQVEPVKQSSIKRITQKTFNQQGGGGERIMGEQGLILIGHQEKLWRILPGILQVKEIKDVYGQYQPRGIRIFISLFIHQN